MNMTKPLIEYQRTLLETPPLFYIELCELCDHHRNAFTNFLSADLHSTSLHEVGQLLESYRLAYDNNPTHRILCYAASIGTAVGVTQRGAHRQSQSGKGQEASCGGRAVRRAWFSLKHQRLTLGSHFSKDRPSIRTREPRCLSFN